MLNFGKKNSTLRRFVMVLLCGALLAACAEINVPQPEPLLATIQAEVQITPPVAVLPTLIQAVSTSTSLPPAPTDTDLPPTPTATPQLAPAQTLPDPQGFGMFPVVDGLEKPVAITHAGDGSTRLFIVEQPGRIRILADGAVGETPFLDITDRVGSDSSEQGLLGLAFHPAYATNGFFYVNYTNRNGDTIISQFSVSAGDPDRADPDSEMRLLHVAQPYPNHNGGPVVFGPDGYLYLGLGDGGAAGDPQGNAQNLDTLLGKLLRLDVDSAQPYAIPADNPFAAGGGAMEIWAYGLRNPWRFSFDPLTGDLYIGDVGQNQWEEIDFLPAGAPGGANFGWDYREGNHPFEGPLAPGLQAIDPVFEYGHNQGCSVTGGVVYRGAELPEFQGVYLFGDYCSGMVHGLLPGPDGSWNHALLFDTGARITSFGADQNGEVYMTGHGGRIFRLVRNP